MTFNTDKLRADIEQQLDELRSNIEAAWKNMTPDAIGAELDQQYERLQEFFDDAEERLPELPAKALAFNRALVDRTIDMLRSVVDNVTESGSRVADTAETATRTAGGQARAAAEQAVSATTTAVKTATGQARAQAKKTAKVASDEIADTLDDATAAVDPDHHSASELGAMTKAELYEIAQARDIDGRSSMTKQQLITALK